MKNIKGFIYTVDALFALIVAAAAISILLFSFYTPTSSSQTPTSEAFAIAQNLLQTSLGTAAHGTFVAHMMVSSFLSGKYSWPQYGYNQSVSSSTPAQGPQLPLVLYSFAAPAAINPIVAADDGLVAFTTSANLYLLNATTGNVMLNISSSSGTFGPPLLYSHNVYVENLIGGLSYISAFSETGNLVWSRQVGALNKYNVLQQEDGYIEENLTFLNPFTGNIVATPSSIQSGGTPIASGTSYSSAFVNGEFLSSAVGQGTGTDYNAVGFALNNGVLSLLWYTLNFISSPNSPPGAPASVSGTTAALAGPGAISSFTIGGKKLWTNVSIGTIRGGAPISNKITYVQTSTGVFAFNQTGNVIFSTGTQANNFNVTPSLSPTLLYTVTNGTQFEAFDSRTGSNVWNTVLSGTPVSSYAGDIALAYGNAYFAIGNMFYAIGTCKADPNSNILQALAQSYLNGNGECANLLLNSVYNSSQLAIFINNTYAPSLKLAHFNGASSVITSYNTFNAVNHLQDNITIAFWVNASPTQSNVFPPIAELGPIGGAPDNHDFIMYFPSVTPNDIQGLAFQYHTAPNVETGPFDSNVVIPEEQYTFMALTLNASKITWYTNGRVTSSTASPGAMQINSSILRIGLSNGPRAYNGVITDFQVYNSSLSSNQISKLYQGGIVAAPIQNASVSLWWPLQGDTNDYAGYHYGFATNVIFSNGGFVPAGLNNAYQVSRASIPISVNSSGQYRTYNIGVVTWR